MFLVVANMYNGVCLLIIGRVPSNRSRENPSMIGHRMFILGEDYTKNIIKIIYCNLKGLLQV